MRHELSPSGHANPALFEGRKRGVIFDVGHGGGSFVWRVAVPIIQEGFLPDSISTDLHASSQNASVKDMLNVMSKFLVLGMPLDEVILRSTWNPAREIQQEQLGHLSVRPRPTWPCCGSSRATSASSMSMAPGCAAING